MSTSIPMMSDRLVGGSNPTNNSELEKARAQLHTYSQGLLITSIFMLFSFWAVYFFPFTLMIGAVCTGLLQYTHTKDYDTMLTNSTIAGPSQVFRYLQLMNLGGVILGAISGLCAVISLIVNAAAPQFEVARFIFTGIAFGAIATITTLAWLGYGKAKEIDGTVVAILTGGIAGAAATGAAATGAAAANASQGLAAYGAPSYGSTQPQPQAATYGTPAPAYGAPPATGAPVFSETPKQDPALPQ